MLSYPALSNHVDAAGAVFVALYANVMEEDARPVLMIDIALFTHVPVHPQRRK